MKPDVLLCACESPEHQVIIRTIDLEPGEAKEVYLSIHLSNYQSFWKRFWAGIRYIFGYTSMYGHWDEIILTKDHVASLENVINYLKDEKAS